MSSLSNQQLVAEPVSTSNTPSQEVILPVNNVAEPYPKELLQDLFKRKDKISAIQELYAVWGYKAGVLDGMCEESPSSSFECQKYLGTLSQIEQQNLPVVMSLYLDGQQSYVVLYQVSDDQVQVLNGQQRISLPKSWLEQLWTGEYYSIWQRELQTTLRLNQQGAQVRLLDEKLSKVLGGTPSGSDIFDEALKRKVEIFQRWQNIDVDGIAGRNTLRKLELLTQNNPPTIEAKQNQEGSL